MTKSSVSFKTLPPELSSHVVRDEPQIYQGRKADVEETKTMYTPAEERCDLLDKNIWKQKTDFILGVFRILMARLGFLCVAFIPSFSFVSRTNLSYSLLLPDVAY